MNFFIIFRDYNYYLKRFYRKLDYYMGIILLKFLNKIYKRSKLKKNFNKLNFKKELFFIFLLENLGDTIRALPVLNHINKESIIICTTYNKGIFELIGFKNIIILNRDPGIIDIFKILKYYRKNKIKYSIILDYTKIKIFSIELAKFINTIVIYKDFYNLNYLEKNCPNEIDILTYFKYLIVKDFVFFNSNIEFKPENKFFLKIRCKNNYKKYNRYIGIHVGGFGSIGYPVPRQYPLKYFFYIIKKLLENGYSIVITGDKFDKKNFEKYSEKLKKYENFENLSGKLSLHELACLLKNISLYITSDNGTLHLAQAVKCKKIFVITGPTSPFLVQGINTEIIRLNLPCSPCFKFLEFPKKCYNKKQHQCLIDLKPNIILNKIKKENIVK